MRSTTDETERSNGTDDDEDFTGVTPTKIDVVRNGIVSVATAIGSGKRELKSLLSEAMYIAAEKSKKRDDELISVKSRYVEVLTFIEEYHGVDMKAADSFRDDKRSEESSVGKCESGNDTIAVQRLIMRPEHFERKEHWLRLVGCRMCCPDNKDMHCKRRRPVPVLSKLKSFDISFSSRKYDQLQSQSGPSVGLGSVNDQIRHASTASRRVQFSTVSGACRCNHGYHRYVPVDAPAAITEGKHAKRAKRSASPFGGRSADLLVGCSSEDHFINRHRSTHDNGLVAESPWQSSQYRLVLLQSLKEKQMLKLIFSALKLDWEKKVLCRNIAQSCGEFRRLQLMKHSFLCLLLEALASKYIVITSYQATASLLVRKYIRPALSRLNRQRLLGKVFERLKVISDDFRGRIRCRYGLSLLRWNCNLKKNTRWAETHVQEMRLARAFAGWISAFIQRNMTNVSLQRRLERADAATPAASMSQKSNRSTKSARSYFSAATQERKPGKHESISVPGDDFLYVEEDEDEAVEKELKTVRAELLTNLFLRRKQSLKYQSQDTEATSILSLQTTPLRGPLYRRVVTTASRDARAVKEGLKSPILCAEELRKRTKKEEEEKLTGVIRQIVDGATAAAGGVSYSPRSDGVAASSMLPTDSFAALNETQAALTVDAGDVDVVSTSSVKFALAPALQRGHKDAGREPQSLFSSASFATDVSSITLSPVRGRSQVPVQDQEIHSTFVSTTSSRGSAVNSASQPTLQSHRSSRSPVSMRGRVFVGSNPCAGSASPSPSGRSPGRRSVVSNAGDTPSYLTPTANSVRMSASKCTATSTSMSGRPPLPFGRASSRSPLRSRDPSPIPSHGDEINIISNQSFSNTARGRSPSINHNQVQSPRRSSAGEVTGASTSPSRETVLLTPGPSLATIDVPLTASKMTPGSRSKFRLSQKRELDRAISASKVRAGYVVASDEKARSFAGSLLKESVKARKIFGGGDVANKSTASSRAWSLERDVIQSRKSQTSSVAFGRTSSGHSLAVPASAPYRKTVGTAVAVNTPQRRTLGRFRTDIADGTSPRSEHVTVDLDVSNCSKSILQRAQSICVANRSPNRTSDTTKGKTENTGGGSVVDGPDASSDETSSTSTSDRSSQLSCDEVELATRLVWRGLWCFRKLQNVARISKAYRNIRQSLCRQQLLRTFAAWRSASDRRERSLQQYEDIRSQRLLISAIRHWEHFALERKFGVQRGAIARSRLRRVWRAWRHARGVKKRNAPRLKYALVLVKAYVRARKRVAWNHWKRKCSVSSKIQLVEKVGRKFELKKTVTQWHRKVMNRMLLQRVFAYFEWAWSQRAARASSGYRLLCAIMDAWKDYTEDRVFEKKSQSAVAFREATLKASVFCAWADIAAGLTIRRAMAAEEAKKNERVYLRRHFLAWKDTFSDKIASVSRLVRALRTKTGLTQKRGIFSAWLKAVQCGYGATYLIYRKALLTRGMKELKMFPRLKRLCQWNNSTRRLRNTSAVFLRWFFLWEDRLRIRKAVNLFQATWDKIMLHRALHRWPGWQQYRAAEHLRQQVIRRRRGSSRLLYLVESAQREVRMKNKQLHDRLEQRAKDEDPSLSSFVVRRRPARALAERVAAMAVQTVCRGLGNVFDDTEHNQSLQVGMYRTAAAAAARMLIADKFIDWASSDTAQYANSGDEMLPLQARNQASISQLQRQHLGTNGDVGAAQERVMVPVQTVASSNILSQAQEQVRTNEELMVRLLLLLIRTVFKAWRRVTAAVISLRERERMVLRTYFERVKHRYLRHWVSRCVATAHRAISWIPKSLPRPHDTYLTKQERRLEMRGILQRQTQAKADAEDDEENNRLVANRRGAAAAAVGGSKKPLGDMNRNGKGNEYYSEENVQTALTTLKLNNNANKTRNGLLGGSMFAGSGIAERAEARKRKQEEHRSRLRHEAHMQVRPDYKKIADMG